MRALKVVMAMMFLLGVCLPANLWAAQDTAVAQVSATIPTAARITLARDINSVTRGSAANIVFDRTDDNDPGVTDPNPGFMYAPYRSEVGKNWHIASLVANGTSMSLSAAVTGTIGTQPLSYVLKVWCGGFFAPGDTDPIEGTATSDDGNPATDDWEYLNGFQRDLSRPFIGTVPFNYRLDIAEVGAGTYNGQVTFTLTST